MIHYDENRCLIVDVLSWMQEGVRIEETETVTCVTLYVGVQSPVKDTDDKPVFAQGVAFFDVTREEYEGLAKLPVGVTVPAYRPKCMVVADKSETLEKIIEVLKVGVQRLKEQGR